MQPPLWECCKFEDGSYSRMRDEKATCAARSCQKNMHFAATTRAKTPDNQIRNADDKVFLMPGGEKKLKLRLKITGRKGELRVKQE